MIFRTALLVVALEASAADVSLLGDSKLTGELEGMSDDGTITLVSPISEKPLKLRSGQVLRVHFDPPADSGAEVPDQRVHLVNGDILPAEITRLDKDVLAVEAPDFGKLEIPRKLVDSIQLGITPQNVLYRGPEDLTGWKRDSDDARSWDFEDDALLATGQGTISREAALPEKFLIRFDLDWESNPNLNFTFADPLDAGGKRADRYSLRFAGGGLELKRESAGSSQPTPIALVNKRPEEFAGGRVGIEVRVDRARGHLHLYVNGELEGRYSDPIPDVPQGTGISFTSQAPGESGQKISGIVIAEWDDRGDRHRGEDRGDGSEDAMIGRYGERFGGRLISVDNDGSGTVYRFKSDFQDDPLVLPESEVSTVFLAESENVSPDDEFEGFLLRLRGGGAIRINGCEFGADKIRVHHPLLGAMTIDRDGVTMLVRETVSKPTESE